MIRKVLSLSLCSMLAFSCATISRPEFWKPKENTKTQTELDIYRMGYSESALVRVKVSQSPNHDMFMICPHRKRSAISWSYAKSIGLDPVETQKTFTNQGEEDTIYVATIPEISLGDILLKDVYVQVLTSSVYPYDDDLVPGFLGRDVLTYFKITYDREKEKLYLSQDKPLGLPSQDPEITVDLKAKYGYIADFEDLGYEAGEDFGMGLFGGFFIGLSGVDLVAEKADIKVEGKPADLFPKLYSGLARPARYATEKGQLVFLKEHKLGSGVVMKNAMVSLRDASSFWSGGTIGTDVWPDYVLLFDYPGEEIGFYKRSKVGKRVARKQALEQAVADVKSGLEKAPGNASLHARMAELYRDAGMLDSAEQEFRKAVELRPKNKYYKRRLANLLMDRYNYGEAREFLEKALKDSNGNYLKAELLLAYLDYFEKKSDKAIKQIDKIATKLGKEDSDYAPTKRERERVYYLYSLLLMEKGDYEGAVKQARKCIDVRGEHEGCRFVSAWAYMKNGQTQAAMDQLEFWLKYNYPSYRRALWFAQKNGKIEELKDLTESLIKRYPGKADLLSLMAEIDAIEKGPGQASSWADKARALNPNNPRHVITAMNIYAFSGNRDKVEDAIKILAGLNPEDSEKVEAAFETMMARYFSKQEEVEKWAKKMESIAATKADKVSAMDNAVMFYAGQGDWNDVLTTMEKRLKLDQSMGEGIMLAYAEALMQNNRKDEATKLLEPLVKRLNELNHHEPFAGPFIKIELADGYRILGRNLKQAMELAREASEIMPHLAEFWDVLGKTALASGDRLEAEKAFKKAESLQPWNPKWKARLKSLGTGI